MSLFIKTTLLLGLASLFAVCASAQRGDQPISLATKWIGTGEKRTMEINATVHRPGTYSVLIRFTEMENLDTQSTVLRVIRNSGNVLRVKPLDYKYPVKSRYTFSYARGYKPRKPDSTFVYQLPYSPYKPGPVRVSFMKNMNKEFFDSDNSVNWAGLLFGMEKGDTIFAVRKGEVVSIRDGVDPRDLDEKVNFTSTRNSMMVEHGDGTICSYNLFEKGSFMVSEGDIVYPGTPLGLSGRQNEKAEDYQLRLFVSYPTVNPNYDPEEKPRRSTPFLNVYCNPVFATAQGNIKLEKGKKYTAVFSPEIVQKEMTKKEIKKYAAAK